MTTIHLQSIFKVRLIWQPIIWRWTSGQQHIWQWYEGSQTFYQDKRGAEWPELSTLEEYVCCSAVVKMSHLIQLMSPQQCITSNVKRRAICHLCLRPSIDCPLSTECVPVIRDPVSNFADTGPRDSGPPHFLKKELLPRNSLQSSTEVVHAPTVPDDRLSHPLHLHRGRGHNYRRQRSDFASLMVRWTEIFDLQTTFLCW